MFKTSPSSRPLLVSSHCNEAAQVFVRSRKNKAALLLGGRFLVAEVLAARLLAVFGFRDVLCVTLSPPQKSARLAGSK